MAKKTDPTTPEFAIIITGKNLSLPKLHGFSTRDDLEEALGRLVDDPENSGKEITVWGTTDISVVRRVEITGLPRRKRTKKAA